MKSSLSIVIPNFNGLDLLAKHLPQVVKYSHKAQIIVVDDASSDDSVVWIKEKYPQIKVIINKTNLGFAHSVNSGFAHTESNLVLLLNNDVSLKKDTIKTLLSHFQDDRLFAVGCLELLPGRRQRGRSQGEFKRGLLIHRAAPKLTPGNSLWIFAASGMFRRSIWNKLGGLDPLYRPAYWEDIDLGYRAWKSGFKCIFDPRAKVVHQSEATMNRVLSYKKNIYAYKNQLLFFWKNITDLDLIFSHLLWTPYHLIVTSIKTRGQFLAGFLLALTQIFEVCSQKTKTKDQLSDKQVIQISSKNP